MRTIRQWYDLSRNRASDFYADLAQLNRQDFIRMVEADLSRPPEGPLRPLTANLGSRKPIPSVAEIQGKGPTEQALQYLFVHRGHLDQPDRPVIEREVPTTPLGVNRDGAVDLLVYDRPRQLPTLVELKRGDAEDSLSGVVLELASHWAFFRRHFDHLRSVMAEASHRISPDDSQPALVIAAPHAYFGETARRAQDPGRHDEMSRARQMVQWLSDSFDVEIRFLGIDDDWLQRGTGFHIVEVTP